MRAEIITVGYELLAGRTVDTHSSYLSRECFRLGIGVHYHTSVGDNYNELYDLLSLAQSRSDLVMLCGGLGPTKDDMTKETLASFIGDPLIQDEDTLRRLQQIFLDRNFIPDNNLKQTYVFSQGVIFENKHGTAPGLAVTHKGVCYVLLPGPPSELIPMFKADVKEYLKGLSDSQVIRTQSLSFFGIGESYLEERLQDIMVSRSDLIVASYVKEAELTLCITAKANNHIEAEQRVEEIKKEVLQRAGMYCYSDKDIALEEVVVSALRRLRGSVSIAESCTGGQLSYLLSSIPGSSGEFLGGWICYTNTIKKEVVGVPEEVLHTYGAVSARTAEILAECALNNYKSQYALSITGVAGPTSIEEKKVGLVYIGLAEKGKVSRTYQFTFSGSRKRIQLFAAKYALFVLLQRIKKGEQNEAF